MQSYENKIIETENAYSKIGEQTGGKFFCEVADRILLTEKLLEKYREIKFDVENSSNIMNVEDEKDINIKLTDIRCENINAFCLTKVNEALRRLKAYPKYGNLYYRIIYDRYIGKNVYTFEEIGKRQKTSKQNILLKKNEAIKVMATILWDSVPSNIALVFAENQMERELKKLPKDNF